MKERGCISFLLELPLWGDCLHIDVIQCVHRGPKIFRFYRGSNTIIIENGKQGCFNLIGLILKLLGFLLFHILVSFFTLRD